ncbi:MAG: hypothetical protein ACK59M_06545 [Pseudomonadota bacterium]|jgi:hypothetical protein
MPIIAALTVLALLMAGMRLAERLGYPFWYGIGVAIPVVNLFVLGAFAFLKSPKERRIEQLESELAAARLARLAGPADGAA